MPKQRFKLQMPLNYGIITGNVVSESVVVGS